MINIIAALDEKRGIGKIGKLPWHLPEDLKHFKELTSGHTVIMGRKTFESIGRPLSDRENIVVTQNPQFQAEGATVVHTLGEALDGAKGDVFIIGGGQVFYETLQRADKLYLTLVEGDFGCDTFFPDYSSFTNEKFIGAGEENGIKYKFLELTK
ncbi:MAG TPA: dihydrofolate reductase [Candidatus Sulfotelmatobacter sp.]|nr:dihydrofolate reductase [Candidatus Sulfotelmatobacter sp.]